MLVSSHRVSYVFYSVKTALWNKLRCNSSIFFQVEGVILHHKTCEIHRTSCNLWVKTEKLENCILSCYGSYSLLFNIWHWLSSPNLTELYIYLKKNKIQVFQIMKFMGKCTVILSSVAKFISVWYTHLNTSQLGCTECTFLSS